MGFMTGVITGVALSAGAAAWYLSRSGERVRERYRVEDKLAELGDQLDARTSELRAQIDRQVADLRAAGPADDWPDPASGLDHDAASAAERAAEVEAHVAAAEDAPTKRVRKPKATDTD